MNLVMMMMIMEDDVVMFISSHVLVIPSSSDVLVGIHVATKYRAALLLFLLVLYFLLSSL